LINALTKSGWDSEKSSLLVDNLELQVEIVEGGVRVPDGYLPEVFRLNSEWGLEVARDNSPTKNILELKLRIPKLNRYLGLPEFEKKLDLLSKGTMTTHQLLRVAIALLINEQRRYSEESAENA